MIKSIRVTNPIGDLLELDLRSSAETVGLLIFNIEGLGPPKASINGQGGPNYDGTQVNSVKTDARHMILTLTVPPNSLIPEEDVRRSIYTFFPIKQTIRFEVETDSKTAYVDSIVESNEMNEFAPVENAVISLYSKRPYWKSIYDEYADINGDTSSSIFEFPFSNESLTDPLLEFGEFLSIPLVIVPYYGVETGLLIELHLTGYVEDVTIINANGNQVMPIDFSEAETFFGGPVQDGDLVFINTRFAEKSIFFVRDDVFYNMINGVTTDADWIQFLPGGNVISVTAGVGTEYIQTQIIYRPLSEGI